MPGKKITSTGLIDVAKLKSELEEIAVANGGGENANTRSGVLNHICLLYTSPSPRDA